MKNQYFGDRNDYFKYDLAIFCCEQLSGTRRLTFIPMLTQDDGSGDGKLIQYRQGAGRGDLHRFLQESVKKKRRTVARLREYFDANGPSFTYCPYGDSLDQEFTHEGRENYFRGVPQAYLKDAVILLDPDNGLEAKTARPKTLHKYLAYAEVENIYHRMGEASVLILYQHLPRVHRKAFLYSIHTKLQELLKCPLPSSVSDGVVAFIIVVKSKKREKELKELLGDYLRLNLTLYD